MVRETDSKTSLRLVKSKTLPIFGGPGSLCIGDVHGSIMRVFMILARQYTVRKMKADLIGVEMMVSMKSWSKPEAVDEREDMTFLDA